jgi:hypothetical protein
VNDDGTYIEKFILTDDRVTGQLASVPRKIQKRRQHFVMVPGIWIERLAKARHIASYRVALHLLYQHWKNTGKPILLPNGMLAREGVTRRQKWEALRELERLGLIAVERRPRRAPLVTVLL